MSCGSKQTEFKHMHSGYLYGEDARDAVAGEGEHAEGAKLLNANGDVRDQIVTQRELFQLIDLQHPLRELG